MLDIINRMLIDDDWSVEVSTASLFDKSIFYIPQAPRVAFPAREPVPFPVPTSDEGTRLDVPLRSKGKLYKARALVNYSNPNYAYIEDKNQKCIKTNLGYVMFCLVVPRSPDAREGEFMYEIPQDGKLETVAVKLSAWSRIAQFRKAGKAEDPLQEVGAMQFVGDNEHLLACRDVISDNKYLYTVMPFLPRGDLLGLIYNGRMGGFPEPVARFVFRQVLSILSYMKEWGVVHRDVSSENIMLDDDGNCILIDMGMAMRLPSGMEGRRRAMLTPQGACGKFSYMSPEVYANVKDFDGYGIDLWAAAVVLFSMLTGANEASIQDDCRILYKQPSMDDAIFVELTRADGQGLDRLLSSWNLSMSESAVDLLQSIFRLNSVDRPSLEEVMAHPWVTDSDVVTRDEMIEFIMLEQF